MDILIGIDDTDTKESRGTGHLARVIAGHLAKDFPVHGVTRHQLLVDPRVPYTAKNSCAAIHLQTNGFSSLQAIFERTAELMLADFQPGSDPGLAVAADVPAQIIDYGRRVQREVISQQEALDLASRYGILLKGLGGTEDGVIGALAALGLAACGNDGRYVMTGTIRELFGVHSVAEIIAAGVREVRTLDGTRLGADVRVPTEKLRAARRGGQPVLYVEQAEDGWRALKLD